MPLVYLPDAEALFHWEPEPGPPPRLLSDLPQAAWTAELVTPAGRRAVPGIKLPLLESATRLAILPTTELNALPDSTAIWALASKLALELVAHERIVPTIVRHSARIEARWAGALSGSEDATRLTALADSMPRAAHAVPAASPNPLAVWAPDALLRAYIDAVVDALVRTSQGAPQLTASSLTQPWNERWRAALAGPTRAFETQGLTERSLVDDLAHWSEPALGARDRLRACFRLDLPAGDHEAFQLSFLLQAPDDPSLLVTASDVWRSRGRSLERLGRAFRDPQESLLASLGNAARLYPPLCAALEQAKPEAIALDPAAAWDFLGRGASILSDAGFGVIVPSELTAAGQRRLRLRMRVGNATKLAGAVAGTAGLGLDELLNVDWQAVIGDTALSPRELAALAKHKAPLVRFRGVWVALDPSELGEIQARLHAAPGRMPVREAVQAALAGETRSGGLNVAVSAVGSFAELLERLRSGSAGDLRAPRGLRARLRPYQERGLAWLGTMSALGLGACLADDMGLGKTIQLLAFLLRRAEEFGNDPRPALLIAPTSVIGNWEREIERFAPSLQLIPHYGTTRRRDPSGFPLQAGSLALATYGVLRRDAELLAQVDWSVVALDEAQNIKNAASATARAACALRASHRFALTGTPVENRLAELWSILEFANPGLLGPLATFRREFAVPIERYRNAEAARRLRRIVGPFILRRQKSDPAVIQDLPAKHEMKVLCTLTREQATLYRAVVDEELRGIAEAAGIERRGRVLALLLRTKQICNHPAQYLAERGPLAGRSGKLARLREMLEEALAAGDKALVFSQFRVMGEHLRSYLSAALGCEVAFLHGGTPKSARDDMVRRFQDEAHGPRVFILSLKAGGTGLNLTAANHVFHFDRWWNPAVEDQATDRAYRIGQARAVQVHKLVCAGTVEDKIDRLLEQKRELAQQVVGSGERWITELSSDDLRALFALADGAVGLSDDPETDSSAASEPALAGGRKQKRSRRAGLQP
jgi:hypothetical protein